jgi:formylmethanofuran dehydrogenase subunit E
MPTLEELLAASAALHRHLCPRQVLGVRMSLHAGELLGLAVPQAENDKRLYVIAETDGCALDGIGTGANCWPGRRTLYIQDYGKVAATFVDTHTERALRLVPRAEARALAREWAPEARNKWEAQLLGYQRMPAEALLCAQPVRLTVPVAELISRPNARAACDLCGEEILNEREVRRAGLVLCQACAGPAYYEPAEAGCAEAAAWQYATAGAAAAALAHP